MAIPVFPSLLRGIARASSQKTEDGTIRDKMEMGQVMTRQRYSRLRRTWKVEYEYLNPTDVTAIDFFYRQTVQGGALPFFWPNLVANGGFEYNTLGPAAGTNCYGIVCDGWDVTSSGGFYISLGSGALANSGSQYLSMLGIPSVAVAAHTTAQASAASTPFPVVAGQNYQYSWNVSVSLYAPPAGMQLIARAILQFLDSANGVVGQTYVADQDSLSSGYVLNSSNYAAPAGAVTAQLVLLCYAVNPTGASITMPATPWFAAGFDDVGVGLSALTPTFGVMPSNGSIPVQVRFPKPVEFADSGYVAQESTYSCKFEMEEV